MWKQLGTFLRHNPLPALVLAGLAGGVLARFGAGQPALARWIWLAALVIGGTPLVVTTLRGMLRGNFASDVVATLSIVTALIMGEYFAGLIIVLMQSGGEALERFSLRRASSALEQLLARAPRRAQRVDGSRLVEIDVDEVRAGDLLVVRPGDLVPVDGTLISEHGAIDESALTGEPLTRAKRAGDRLLSGGVNRGHAAEMRATAVAAASQYAKMVELVRRAQQEKPPLQRLADRYAVWFTPATLAMCAFGWLITGEPRTILAVLVVATPCPLILAVPVAVIGGVNRAARSGIIVKGGAALEQIGRARAVVFDKTGTLTYGTPAVTAVEPFGDTTLADLLRAAGGAEQLSAHPVGVALAAEARRRVGALPRPEHFHEAPGRGVEAEFGTRRVLVGSPGFLAERGVDTSLVAEGGGGLAAYVAIAGQLAGVVRLDDQLRPGVPDLLRRLARLGVRHTAMLTGDNAANATAIGARAGIAQVEADLLPVDKVRLLAALRARYAPVVMVGDGINDAPALASATVGVAMGAKGTGISAEAADIVLLEDDVTKVGEAIAIGQWMLRIAKQSIYVGLGLSFAFMVVASFGHIPPAAGALLQELIDVAVILNALRALGSGAAPDRPPDPETVPGAMRADPALPVAGSATPAGLATRRPAETEGG
jgi:heavy metal translocating P-type ATPase